MFDARGRPKKLIELGDNEAAAIAVFEVSEKLLGHDHTKKQKRTYKLKFVDRLGAFALLAKACHYYVVHVAGRAIPGVLICESCGQRIVHWKKAPTTDVN